MLNLKVRMRLQYRVRAAVWEQEWECYGKDNEALMHGSAAPPIFQIALHSVSPKHSFFSFQ